MQVTIEVPEAVGRLLGTPAERPRRVRDAVVAEAYRDGALTRGQVGEILGMDFYETEAWLRRKQLPCGYDVDDLAQDRQALARLLGAR